jgi:hypothetical protein
LKFVTQQNKNCTDIKGRIEKESGPDKLFNETSRRGCLLSKDKPIQKSFPVLHTEKIPFIAGDGYETF